MRSAGRTPTILAEFEGEKDIDVVTARPRGGTGDVKYHQGATGTYKTDEGKEIARHPRERTRATSSSSTPSWRVAPARSRPSATSRRPSTSRGARCRS